jgi:demethylmenaquinone methyltransferase/2-methoxy-6-polyprenyl-1,4-benzoquinol methylase
MEGGSSRDAARVQEMFGGIAPRYDLLNRVLSANLDRGWRRAAVRHLPETGGGRVLDLCGGTGDLALDLARLGRAEVVVCCDFSHPMLLRASRKFGRGPAGGRCLALEADGLRLPLATGSFDTVTIAFGLRNLADPDVGLAEMRRVLGRGGHLVVLEFSRPPGPVLSRLYGFYLRRVLPRVGDAIARGRGAYRYLARTIGDFPDAATLAARIEAAGFVECRWSHRSGGIVAIHTATRAD